MIWVWSKLSAVKWMDAWEERFYGNQNAVISLLKGGARLRVEVYCEKESEALDLQNYWGGSVRKLVQENWVAKSATVKPPMKIRRRLVVTMEGDGKKLDALRREFNDRHVLSIPPEMAFGTGDHPTTANCLRLLVDEAAVREKGTWSFLDLGTGSGLLAIAARKLGAAAVVGVDYDAAAVAVARRNCERNGVLLEDEAMLRMEEGDIFSWEAGGQSELVVANLFSDVLIAGMPRIEGWLHPEGRLIVSGILNEQWPAVKQAAAEVGIQFREPIVRGKWSTAIGQRGEDS